MNLTKDQHDALVRWITEYLRPWNKFNHQKTSYGLKHTFEFDHDHGGFYVDNDTFKSVMVELGYRVYDEKDVNWQFNVDPCSPAFRSSK